MKTMMRALPVLCVAFAGLTALGGKPVMVGHRGSDVGLENSVESFTAGALRGYEYLETDWKLTADSQFVCSHDDSTTRLGGTLALATSTLAELQAEPLTQTRRGTTYTGRLCSAREYLEVCRRYGVKPLIELKWTNGINSKDCSNIPLLIKFIEENGFRDSCIILTSMRPCLEYIREHYPDIRLQFLTGKYQRDHADWAIANRLDVDIMRGCFDTTDLKRYHDAGLRVNVWTVNSASDSLRYTDTIPCDFITTDRLLP
ncbi:MAG: hypothetical protein MRZ32_00205 [Bacteroidales bacterium]|nr:hypothetical protein [Bacteroidales bacterium]MDY2917712.1 glycerophosphodiester phosphodiesterase family protein [Muribaculaceae bacterium]